VTYCCSCCCHYYDKSTGYTALTMSRGYYTCIRKAKRPSEEKANVVFIVFEQANSRRAQKLVDSSMHRLIARTHASSAFKHITSGDVTRAYDKQQREAIHRVTVT